MNATAIATEVCIGVGIDTSRYGHHATFLCEGARRKEVEAACPPLEVSENRAGYEKLHDRLRQLAAKHPGVRFLVRLDAAGQYAANLQTFLQRLPLDIELSVGDPQRNQHYRKTHFPKRKADATESYCAARFALLERPRPVRPVPPEIEELREIAGRLESQTRQVTRVVNQLHNLLARVFPELAMVTGNLAAGWVVELLSRYPTPEKLARARRESLEGIRHLPHAKIEPLRKAARQSVATCRGEVAADLVQELAEHLGYQQSREKRLLKLLVNKYRALPESNHLATILGIGEPSAAVLTAKIIHIDRFATADYLVSYFGTFPEEDASGLDAQGSPRPGRHTRMSKRGNDLVRKYLWNAAMTAIRVNPAVRALYQRKIREGKKPGVALGHAMRKLLHLVFAVWKTGKPFDPQHYPWESAQRAEEAAGHNQGSSPDISVVTTASDSNVAEASRSVELPGADSAPRRSDRRIDFAALRQQVSLERVLAHLGWLERLRGPRAQRRGPCPVHASQKPRNRTFSVQLDRGLFQCFEPSCGIHGNVLDLWAAVRCLPLYEAALDLASTFNLQLAFFPPNREVGYRG